MTQQVDILIRRGMIADGNGGEPYEADIAIRDGRIAAVGHGIDARGTEEFDAKGLLVTPGFVDLHTHYDAQVTFSDSIGSSSWNGVTTVLIGNCGVGFAPCLPERREMLIRLMEGVEDLPEVVLTAGIPWNWESFPQFLDALANCLLRNFASCPIAFTLGIGFPPPVGATALLRSSVFSFLSVSGHGFSPRCVCLS